MAYDPSSLDLFPIGWSSYGSADVRGVVYYPSHADGKEQPFAHQLPTAPIVFIAHGNFSNLVSSYLGYVYFQQVLARMGIISVSINANALTEYGGYSTTNIEQRADLFLKTIKHFQNLDKTRFVPTVLRKGHLKEPAPRPDFFGRIDFGQVGLMGHSRGGEAALILMEEIAKGIRGVNAVAIKAVLALAPSGYILRFSPASRKGFAFMTILPAGDGDAWRYGGAVAYDQTTPSPFKSQLYVHLANHNWFNREWKPNDSLNDDARPTPTIMYPSEHEQVLNVYGSAFFRATLLGHATIKYISGEELPAGVEHQNVHLSFKQEEALTVDDHEQSNGIEINSLNQPTSGGYFVQEYNFRQEGTYADFTTDPLSSFIGMTRGMYINTFNPFGPRTFESSLGAVYNLMNCEIWIRAAQTCDNRTAGLLTPTSFALGLRDASDSVSWIDSDAIGTLPPPYDRKLQTRPTVFKTFRFPAFLFARDMQFDITSVKAILIGCNRTDPTPIAFDDLQVIPAGKQLQGTNFETRYLNPQLARLTNISHRHDKNIPRDPRTLRPTRG